MSDIFLLSVKCWIILNGVLQKNSQTDWFDRKTEINHAFTLNVENKQRTERLKQTGNVNLTHILSTYNLGIYNIDWFYSSRSYKLTLVAAYRFHLTTVKKRVPECSEEPFLASGSREESSWVCRGTFPCVMKGIRECTENPTPESGRGFVSVPKNQRPASGREFVSVPKTYPCIRKGIRKWIRGTYPWVRKRVSECIEEPTPTSGREFVSLQRTYSCVRNRVSWVYSGT